MKSWEYWYPVFKEELEKQMSIATSVSEVHKQDHIKRVWETSKELCVKTGGDLEVMIAATFFHDIGRHYNLEIHGHKSAELTGPILERLKFPSDKISMVLEAIAQHDYTYPPSHRKLLEARILYDADKIDAFGAIGVYRHILFIRDGRMQLRDVLRVLSNRWDGLSLEESKKYAQKKYEYIVNYFEELIRDLL